MFGPRGLPSPKHLSAACVTTLPSQLCWGKAEPFQRHRGTWSWALLPTAHLIINPLETTQATLPLQHQTD